MSLDITDPKLITLKNDESRFVKLKKLKYTKNKKRLSWELVKRPDFVCCLIFNKEKNSLIMVKQTRPAICYRILREGKKYTPKNQNTFSYELCAGMIDKPNKSLKEITKEEIEEECGYRIKDAEKRLKKINEFYDIARSGQRGILYYCEVTDDEKVSEGGGDEKEGEFLEVFELKINDIHSFMNDFEKKKTCSLLFSLMWFIINKKQLLKDKKK